jgi:putative Holliday junction resolvase
MRLLGLDVGERRIGVALSDPLGLTAQRLTVLKRAGGREDLDAVCALIAKHGVAAVAVGLPLTLKGTHGPQAQRATSFAHALSRQSTVPVHLVDERLTTAQGERALLATDTSRRRRKQLIDQVAAQLILQQYLDTHAT